MRIELQIAAHWLVIAYKQALSEYYKNGKVANIRFTGTTDEGSVPDCLGMLRQQFSQENVNISLNNNDTSIYGEAGNFLFRCFHDTGHIVYGKRFTFEDEVNLAMRQLDDVLRHIPTEFREDAAAAYLADTVAMSWHAYMLAGAFPENQTAFCTYVFLVLRDPFCTATVEDVVRRYIRDTQPPALAAAPDLVEFASGVLSLNQRIKAAAQWRAKLRQYVSRAWKKPRYPYGEPNHG